MSSKKNPIWISHRGLCQKNDENTNSSFMAATEYNFSVLETDLRLTKDNYLVLLHDEDLTRITKNNIKKKVSELTKAELSDIELSKGDKILFLTDFIDTFSEYQWVFDVKPESAKEAIEILFLILKENPNLLKNIFFLFWDSRHQEHLLSKLPEAQCFARIEECKRANFSFILGLDFLSGVKEGKIYSIPPSFFGFKVLSKKIVKKFHDRGAKVIGYLPESETEAQLAIDSGCDFIITNHPPIK